jgi:hypothetical protein
MLTEDVDDGRAARSGEQVDVALDQRGLRDDRDRVPEAAHHLEQRARDFELALDRLIRVRARADVDRLADIAAPSQLRIEQLRGVLLVEKLRLEIEPGATDSRTSGRDGRSSTHIPCSHPRYGLIETSKPTSGESLRVRMLFACSAVTVVWSGGSSFASSSPLQPSSTTSTRRDSKRPSGFEIAPRPLMISGGFGMTV